MEQLIADYGYLAVVAVTFIEGETIVIFAGFAAHLGYLELPWVIAAALGGSFSGDQFWYYIGRRWGPKIIAKRPSWQERATKIYRLLHRHQYWLMSTFRFWYGLRSLTPFALGAAQVPPLRYFTLNLAGAFVWAISFAYVGYLLGEASKYIIHDLQRYGLYLLGGLVIVALLLWLTGLMRQRRNAREQAGLTEG